MRLHDTTVNQHPPRLVGRRAKGLLTALMLTLWFCDFGTGGSALAQNIQFTPVSYTHLTLPTSDLV